MRGLGALALLGAFRLGAAHPLCYIDARATDYDEVLTFCPEQQFGACCTDAEELEVIARFDAVGTLTGDCEDLYRQVVCGVCNSYSGHLYERLGGELGVLDGMTMKNEFCDELVTACSGQITFPTYDGDDYCTKHTGGTTDQFWSYPYTEAETDEDGLTALFPSLDTDADFPSQTISVAQSPDNSMYWLLGQDGQVVSVDASDLTTTATVVDISSGDLIVSLEEGLIDFAFAPLFGTTGYPSYFYLSYTCQLNDGAMPRNRLSKFEYFAGDPASTLASEEILITTAPKIGEIHSAGWVGFKPSDYGTTAAYHDVYWSIGDSGAQEDPDNNSQNTTNHLGSMIRISVPSDGTGYEIPTGNLASPALPEICANGFRNPWRCGFDRETDELYCGDVGNVLVEEIDIVECGNNYGWSRFEGSRCHEAQEDRDGPCLDADRSGYTFPTFEYCHSDYFSDSDSEEYTGGVDICGSRDVTGTCVIGGSVYRGTYYSDVLAGAYIFGEYTDSNIFYIRQEAGEWVVGSIISDSSVAIIGFAEDNSGEMLIITRDHNIYYLPCGDLCLSTCLDQAEVQPSYESLGCFADVRDDRALEIDDSILACTVAERVMSPAICASYCYTLGATYAGLQFGYQCFCGVDSDYSRHGTSTSCDYECQGNPTETCGGFLTIEVYEVGEPVTSVSSALMLAEGPTAAGDDDTSSSPPSKTMVGGLVVFMVQVFGLASIYVHMAL